MRFGAESRGLSACTGSASGSFCTPHPHQAKQAVGVPELRRREPLSPYDAQGMDLNGSWPNDGTGRALRKGRLDEAGPAMSRKGLGRVPGYSPIPSILGLSGREDWAADVWPSLWTRGTLISAELGSKKLREVRKEECLGSGQDMCVMGTRVLCHGGLWALTA